MKKLTKIGVILLLILMLGIMLTGCKSKKAKAIDEAIEAIGEVTLDSESAIIAAEGKLNGADADTRAQVENEEVLTEARDTYNALLVEKAIDDLGTITADSGDELSKIEAMFDKLSRKWKQNLSNYDKLVEAQKTYAAAVEDATVDTLNTFIANLGAVTLDNGYEIDVQYWAMMQLNQSAYVRITNPARLINAYNKYQALLIEKAINDIGEITADYSCKQAISKAREKYDEADSEVLVYVTNYGTLTYAESRYAYLKEIKDAEQKAKKEAEELEALQIYSDREPFVGMDVKYIDYTILGPHDEIGHNSDFADATKSAPAKRTYYTLYRWKEGHTYTFSAKVKDTTGEVVWAKAYPFGK